MRKAIDHYVETHDGTENYKPAAAGDQQLHELSETLGTISVSTHDTDGATKDVPIFEGIASRLRTNDRSNFFVSVELDPPRGAIPRKLLQAATMVKEAGADTINVGDSPMAAIKFRPGAEEPLAGTPVDGDEDGDKKGPSHRPYSFQQRRNKKI